MRLALMLAGCTALIACIFDAPQPTAAPQLTEAQNERVPYLGVYRRGETPWQKYSVIAPIESADCSGANAIEILKKKAVALGGDAVVEVSCGDASLSNCPAARKCTGNAVRWN